eukprot:9736564-Alexandrium_andersonii.AAC.1
MQLPPSTINKAVGGQTGAVVSGLLNGGKTAPWSARGSPQRLLIWQGKKDERQVHHQARCA